MAKNRILPLTIAILVFSANLFAQISIKSLPFDDKISADQILFGSSQTRTVKILNHNWKVYWEKNPSDKISTTVPSTFTGENKLVYETTVSFSEEQLAYNTIRLCFLGLNYSCEILLNNYSIFKRSSGEIPFDVELPSDLLKADTNNKITIKVDSELSSETTIPVKQGFLFPENTSGIVRDVFLKLIPKTNIADVKINKSIDKNYSKANLNFSIVVQNPNLLAKELNTNEEVTLRVSLRNSISSETKIDKKIDDFEKDELTIPVEMEIQNPSLWSPESPNLYSLEIALYKGSTIVDVINSSIAFSKFEVTSKNITLNNNAIALKGTTYFLNELQLQKITVYDKIRNDLQLIKNTGFNAVRFSKVYPHPYELEICRKIGLIPLIEMPLNSIPEEIISDSDFKLRAVNRLKEFVDTYSNYSDVFILGLGSGFLANSSATEQFVSGLSEAINNNILTYASFAGVQSNEISGVDLYGIELFTRSSDVTRSFLEGIGNDAKYFLSEVNYPNYLGSSSGYLVQNSYEAQAKFFENTIEITARENLGGFFLSTLYNYSGNYKSLFAGYSAANSYSLGYLKNNGSLNSLPYKVIEAKLKQTGKVTIPIGNVSDGNKLMFIIIALGLTILLAVLINTRKKFREDCTRALFRPYNFFADIRDQRIISSIHTVILLFVEAGSASLLFTIILFYLKSNILLEKILLSFGNVSYVNMVSGLAWHPEKCFFYLFAVLIIKIAFITILIKLASLFIKTKINYTSIFFAVVWALLPFTLLLPVELILFKILVSYGMNIYILAILTVFMLWVLQRILKGIHVIFDVSKIPVYIYSIAFVLLVIGTTLVYYQLTNSTIYYISNAIKQFKASAF